MSLSYQIVKGEIHHLNAVLSLINELAVFEKEPNAVINTLAEMEMCWKQKQYDFTVVKVKENIVGFALYYFRYSTWKGLCLYLEDFYIQAEYRSLGIGAKVFDYVANIATENNCKLLNWQVLDWNTEAIKFYERKGAEISKEWYNGTLKISLN